MRTQAELLERIWNVMIRANTEAKSNRTAARGKAEQALVLARLL